MLEKPYPGKSALNRIAHIESELEKGGFNSVEFARLWECSKRTIQRDIEFMRDFFGAKIKYNPQRWRYERAGGPSIFTREAKEAIC